MLRAFHFAAFFFADYRPPIFTDIFISSPFIEPAMMFLHFADIIFAHFCAPRYAARRCADCHDFFIAAVHIFSQSPDAEASPIISATPMRCAILFSLRSRFQPSRRRLRREATPSPLIRHIIAGRQRRLPRFR